MDLALKYSVVVSVFNSAHCLEELTQRIAMVMTPYAPFELLLIDDFSNDNSWEIICRLKKELHFVRGIRLTRNFGQAAVAICGIRESKAPIIISIDDDLQYQPEDISLLINHFDPVKNYAVFGVPARKKYSVLRKITSFLVEKTIQMLVKDFGTKKLRFSSFRIYKRYENTSGRYSERTLRNLQVFFTMVSPQLMDHVEVSHHPRKKGKSNYNIFSKWKLYFEMVVTLGEFPLFFFAILGFIGSITALVGFLLWMANFQVGLFINIALLTMASLLAFGFSFLFVYLRSNYLSYQGADVYAIWEEI